MLSFARERERVTFRHTLTATSWTPYLRGYSSVCQGRWREGEEGKAGTEDGTPPSFSDLFSRGRCGNNLNSILWCVAPSATLNWTFRYFTRMARPHPTLAVTDSDRTLILQRRGRCNTTSKRSAYFADSDSSSVCGEPPAQPPPEVKSSRTPAAASAAGTASSWGASRTGGRWILEGIRRSQQGQPRETPTIKDEQDRAPVFYGSVRFPASRVALWYVVIAYVKFKLCI